MARTTTREELIVIAVPNVMGGRRGWAARGERLRETELQKIATQGGCALRPLFGSKRKKGLPTVRPRYRRAVGAAPGGRGEGGGAGPAADVWRGGEAGACDVLDGFYTGYGPSDALRATARQLLKLPEVLAAYVRPGAELARQFPASAEPAALEGHPVASSARGKQAYLGPAPLGTGARLAWEADRGAFGKGVRLVDIEWGWRFGHEDLASLNARVLKGEESEAPSDVEHGTAVLGVLSARHNTFGVDGFVPEAQVDVVALVNSDEPDIVSPPLAEAIRLAADHLAPGDIILLEVQLPGPAINFESNPDDERGYIAPEWWPDVFAAIRYATKCGILVVEAAGNGAQNLDDPLYDVPGERFPSWWSNPFAKGGMGSGAILVAAGTDEEAARRMFNTNYGARVDARGWGRRVATTGYGAPGVAPEKAYTDDFNGTSSAAAIVAGALACIQGVLLRNHKTTLRPEEAVKLLRGSGTPPRPGTLIGNLPNVPEMMSALLP